ncbi:hypothetical protein FTO70_02550 [Methanosarcina sp. KYL-1]|nr:hypothetical protein [Methanosarcina sp. KYL-1]
MHPETQTKSEPGNSEIQKNRQDFHPATTSLFLKNRLPLSAADKQAPTRKKLAQKEKISAQNPENFQKN